MTHAVRIALANLAYPTSRDASVSLACAAVAEAGTAGASILCFPECYVPGYRSSARATDAPDARWLAAALADVGAAAATSRLTVVLGTERVTPEGLRASAVVIGPDGVVGGVQEKVQIDPSEQGRYVPGTGRRLFQAGPVTFGVTICHEGWRYPETVRWAARRGAQVVFHQAFHEAEPDGYRPLTFADPANTFHEKAVLCRAAENTCYVATVNYASVGSPTTSAVARPDGTVLCWQPYGVAGLLIADLDLTQATGLLASRYTPCD
jgi:predicted amidohydrolase